MPKINSYDKGEQDWDVVVTKRNPVSNSKSGSNSVTGGSTEGGISKMRKLELAEDVALAPRITIDLRLQIQRARSSKGLTQKQLAAHMSVPVNFIQNCENGKAAPTGAFLDRLERVLSVKFERHTKKNKESMKK